MSINVIQLVQSALSDGVVRQLSGRLGLAPETTQKVIGEAMPALVAAFMNRGATVDGARSLFAMIMSPQVNAHLGDQFPQILASTAGMSQLESAGRHLIAQVTGRPADALSDTIATQTGVAAHSAHALTGIVGATVLGVLKRPFVDGRGSVGQLPTLLGHQLPAITAHLNDGLLSALGLGSVAGFVGSILSQLKLTSSHLEHPAPVAAAPVEPAARPTATAPVEALVREERPARQWLWWLLAAAAAALAFLVLRGCHDARDSDVAQAQPAPPSAAVAVGARHSGAGPGERGAGAAARRRARADARCPVDRHGRSRRRAEA